MIEIDLTPEGGIAMLHDDAVSLEDFGRVDVSRASNVEFADGVNGFDIARGWYVQSAKTLQILKSGFPTRALALTWEKEWYSPSGPGWKELTEVA